MGPEPEPLDVSEKGVGLRAVCRSTTLPWKPSGLIFGLSLSSVCHWTCRLVDLTLLNGILMGSNAGKVASWPSCWQ